MFTAKSEEKLCEDCEAGDGGAGQGAAPDRTCGYTQRNLHKRRLCKLIKPMGRRTGITGLREGRQSPNPRLLPLAAVAGPRA